MSGGAFDYAQYRIADIYTEIEDEIYGHSLDDEFDVNRYIEDHWLEDSEKEYVRKHHHTIPNRSEYSKETIKEFKKGIALLKKAEVYAQRIDWLLSGDDGGEVFGGTDTCSALFSNKEVDIGDYSDWEMIDGKHYCPDCYEVEVIDGVYNVKAK